MKVKLFSFAVSLLFFPASLIGNLLGGAAVDIYVWLNNYFLSPHTLYGIPDWIKYPLGSIFVGIVGGWLAAKAIKKIYKNVDLRYAMIFPVLLIIFGFYIDLTDAINNNNIWAATTFGHGIRHICTISSYYIFLKNE
tara:strand:- start:54 stop:464 length:411 start_codon:yes stop_codon:yes gene_type:complete